MKVPGEDVKEEAKQEESKNGEEEEKKDNVVLMNLGKHLLHKVMHRTKEALNREQEDQVRATLLSNYDDYVAIKAYYEQHPDVSGDGLNSVRVDPKELAKPKFVSLHDSSNNRPLW